MLCDIIDKWGEKHGDIYRTSKTNQAMEIGKKYIKLGLLQERESGQMIKNVKQSSGIINY